MAAVTYFVCVFIAFLTLSHKVAFGHTQHKFNLEYSDKIYTLINVTHIDGDLCLHSEYAIYSNKNSYITPELRFDICKASYELMGKPFEDEFTSQCHKDSDSIRTRANPCFVVCQSVIPSTEPDTTHKCLNLNKFLITDVPCGKNHFCDSDGCCVEKLPEPINEDATEKPPEEKVPSETDPEIKDPTEHEPKDPEVKDPTEHEPKDPEVKDPTEHEPKDPEVKDPTENEPKDPEVKDPTEHEPKDTEVKDPTEHEPKDPEVKDPTEHEPHDPEDPEPHIPKQEEIPNETESETKDPDHHHKDGENATVIDSHLSNNSNSSNSVDLLTGHIPKANYTCLSSGYFADKTNPQIFYHCKFFATLHECAPDEKFDTTLHQCIYDEKTEDPALDFFKWKNAIHCSSSGTFVSPYNCKYFYTCVPDHDDDYHIYFDFCFGNLIFNESTGQCDYKKHRCNNVLKLEEESL